MNSAARGTKGRRLKAEGKKIFSGYSRQPTAYSLRSLGRARGVTLIELIAFIVIVAFVVVAMVQAFSGTAKGVATGKMLTAATEAAQQRMEAILAQVRFLRSSVGYAGINAGNYDPCPPLGTWANQACSSGSSTVASSANFAADSCGIGAGTQCFLVTVTAIDVNSSLGAPLTLTYQIWNY